MINLNISSKIVGSLLICLFINSFNCSINEITIDSIESKETQTSLDDEDYAMVLVYHSKQNPEFAKCKETLEHLNRNFEENVSFYLADLQNGPEILNYFEIPKDSKTESGFMTIDNCLWTLNVFGNSIQYHNENHDFEALSFWLETRMNNKILKIKSSEEFYKATSKYFAGVYAYLPRKEDSPELIDENKKEIKKRLRALASEFPSSKFYYSFDPLVNQQVKINITHSFILARSFEDGHKSILDNSLIKFRHLRSKVARYRFPFILWWNEQVAQFIDQEQENVTILIVRKRKNYQLEATFERIARLYDDQNMRFAILEINGNKVTKSQRLLLKELNITPKSNIPTTVTLMHDKKEKKVRSIRCDNMTEDGIKNFIGGQFGRTVDNHCLQNQFLKRGWKYSYVKPINFDWLLELTANRTPSSKVVFLYRSHNKADSPLIKRFINLSKAVQKSKSKDIEFYIFDSRLNEPPKYLVEAKASVPGLLFLLSDKVDDDGKYQPQYSSINTFENIYTEIDKMLGINSKKLIRRMKKRNKTKATITKTIA